MEEDPIAVIGMACKLPGDVSCPEDLWDLMSSGRSAVTDVPPERYNVDAFYHPDATRLDSLSTKRAHFITEDIGTFDTQFFGVSPAEATCMDPQQRKLLETTYHALENAGLTIDAIAASQTSVFIGTFGTREYDLISTRYMQTIPKHHALGTGVALLSNRISHFFDLRGPSITIDTACSGSLYALHLACQSLISGESEASIVGGSNVILTADGFTMSLSNGGFLSPSGTSRSFDESADGYGRGEGFGVVVLKRLSRAIRDGDTVRSVIRSIAVNNDGKTPSLTQPSPDAQAKLIKHTYGLVGIGLSDTAYVEAHGTGTRIGDPIEANTIGSVFKRDKGMPLSVGAVKSNIGHLEGASGIASLIKTTLMLEKGMIPPIVWLNTVNPLIEAGKYNLRFSKELSQWPVQGLRRASINNFGYGGANAHAVLDDARHYLEARDLPGSHRTQSCNLMPSSSTRETGIQSESQCADNEFQYRLILLSSADESGITRVAQSLQKYCRDRVSQHGASVSIDSLSYTLGNKRTKLRWRSFYLSPSYADIAENMTHCLTSPVRRDERSSIVLLFTGQGAQWDCMGQELWQYPIARQSVQAADEYLRGLGCTWSLIGALIDDQDQRIHTARISQPICAVLQVALVDLLSSWGLRPSFALGFSSGEIAAAYSAGAISREQAWRIAYCKGLICDELGLKQHESLGMMAVALSQNECALQITEADLSDRVFVACLNSPRSTTLAGPIDDLQDIERSLGTQGVFTKMLKVDNAYHSPWVKSQADRLAEDLGELNQSRDGPFGANMPLLYSTTTGGLITRPSLADKDHWRLNMVRSVDFRGAIKALYKDNITRDHENLLFIELGPHAVLKRPLLETLEDLKTSKTTQYLPTLRSNNTRRTSIPELVGNLFLYGISLDAFHARGLIRDRPNLLIDLPTYPFNHSQRFWHSNRIYDNLQKRRHARHELLGTREVDWNAAEPCWKNTVRIAEQPWVMDHCVDGAIVYPASGFILIAVHALRELLPRDSDKGGYRLSKISFKRSLRIAQEPQESELRTVLRQQEGAVVPENPVYEFRIFGRTDGDWFEACRGYIKHETGKPHSFDESRHAQIREQCDQFMRSKLLYKTFTASGFGYGSAFQSLQDVRFNEKGECSGRIITQPKLASDAHGNPHTQPMLTHPITLDALFQLGLAGSLAVVPGKFPPMMPRFTGSVWLSDSLLTRDTMLDLSSQITKTGLREHEWDITGTDSNGGEPLILVKDHRATALTSFSQSTATLAANTGQDSAPILQWAWKPDLSMMDNTTVESYLNSRLDSSLCLSEQHISEAETLAIEYGRTALNRLPMDSIGYAPLYIRRYARWLRTAIQSASSSESKSASIEVTENPITKVVSLIGEKLPEIFAGTTSSLQVLFGGSGADEWYQHILDAPGSWIADYLDHISHANPDIRICELGSGTGGLTSHVLNSLTADVGDGRSLLRFSEYAFTDISPAFFEKAKKRFQKQSSCMRYQVFDISVDAGLQGLDLEQYDIVLAGMVVHAAPDLAFALRNIRQVMKEGAKLILVEQDPDGLIDRFVSGTLEGWWAGVETFRPDCALINQERWRSLLIDAGFSGIDMTSGKQAASDPIRTIISTAVPDQGHILPASPVKKHTGRRLGEDFIVFARSALQAAQAISECLRSEGYRSQVVDRVPKVSEGYWNGRTLVLLLELDDSEIELLSDNEFDYLYKGLDQARHVIWMTRGAADQPSKPQLGKAEGITRSLCTEKGTAKATLISLDADCPDERLLRHFASVLRRLQSCEQEQVELQYREKHKHLCVGRFDPLYRANSRLAALQQEEVKVFSFDSQERKPNVTLKIGSLGALDTLSFVAGQAHMTPPSDDEVHVEIMAAAVSMRDVHIAMGQAVAQGIGSEAAGVVVAAGSRSTFSPGQRVFCFTDRAVGTYARCQAHNTFLIPTSMPYTVAATMLLAWATAHVALDRLARTQADETVLINSSAGPFVQAALQLARLRRARVFLAADSATKRAQLSEIYRLPEHCLLDDRSSTFSTVVRQLTQNKGLDVVLTTRGGESLEQSLALLAPFGRVVRLGKPLTTSDVDIEAAIGHKGATYSSVDLYDPEAAAMRSLAIAEMLKLISENLTDFHTTLPLRQFPASKATDAFRCLQSGHEAGAVVIEFNGGGEIRYHEPAVRPAALVSDGIYVVAGGLGGLGRSLIRWMVHRGARNIVVLSRSGAAKSPRTMSFVKRLRKDGVSIAVPKCDITDGTQVESTLKEATRLSNLTIKGCIQAAMVLQDANVRDMTLGRMQAALAPKVRGTLNLINYLPDDMDFFIMLSSVSGAYGGYSQTNYAAGNTFQDALARSLAGKACRAVSLNLGPIETAGYAAEHNLVDQMTNLGYGSATVEQVLDLLGLLCDPTWHMPNGPIEDTQMMLGLPMPDSTQASDLGMLNRPTFRLLHHISSGGDHIDGKENVPIRQQFAKEIVDAEDIAAATAILVAGLRTKLSAVLNVKFTEVDPMRSLDRAGIDSLMAVEIKHWFLKEVKVEVPVQHILTQGSLVALCEGVVGEVRATSQTSDRL